MNESKKGVPTRAHLDAARSLWGLEGPIVPVRNVTNAVYAAQLGGEDVFLRLGAGHERDPALVRSELHWMRHLERAGVALAPPVRSLADHDAEILHGAGTHTFTAAVFRKAEGMRLSTFHAEALATWGETLARFHEATRGYVPEEGVTHRPGPLAEGLIGTVLAAQASGALARDPALDAALAWMGKLPRSEATFGLVHADFHTGNFFVHEGRITAFDFDDCCFHWFAYDLAVAVASAAYERRCAAPGANASTLVEEALRDFATGYERVRSLGSEEAARVVLFVHYRTRALRHWLDVRTAQKPELAGDTAWRKAYDAWTREVEATLPRFPRTGFG